MADPRRRSGPGRVDAPGVQPRVRLGLPHEAAAPRAERHHDARREARPEFLLVPVRSAMLSCFYMVARCMLMPSLMLRSGKGLGGSSILNFLFWTRPSHKEIDGEYNLSVRRVRYVGTSSAHTRAP